MIGYQTASMNLAYAFWQISITIPSRLEFPCALGNARVVRGGRDSGRGCIKGTENNSENSWSFLYITLSRL